MSTRFGPAVTDNSNEAGINVENKGAEGVEQDIEKVEGKEREDNDEDEGKGKHPDCMSGIEHGVGHLEL